MEAFSRSGARARQKSSSASLQRLTGEQDGGAFPEAGVGGGRVVE